MSRILICGDWHGNFRWAKKFIDIAAKEDIEKIIQVGDFGIWPGFEGREYLLILSRYLVKRSIKLHFVPGNHEDYNQIDAWSKRFKLNDDGHMEIEPNLFYAGKVNSWEWEGKKFASVGGAYSIDRKYRKLNESWWAQEILTDEEEKSAIEIGRVDYLFTHDCPTGHPFKHLKNDLNSEIHRNRMSKIGQALRPSNWFHGHYHFPADYSFKHQKGYANVYSLDADDRATDIPTIYRHAAVLDTDTGDVVRLDRDFESYGLKKF